MIKARLIELVPSSKKYIFLNVLFQWLGMLANVFLILEITKLLGSLQGGQANITNESLGIIAATVVARVCCLKLAAWASCYASKSVKRTLRSLIYEKLLALGGSYKEQTTTAEVIQLAGEGVEQLESYFGNYVPQLFYALLAPITLFAVLGQTSLTVAIALFVCVPLIPVSIVIVQKIAKRLMGNYWEQYATLGDSFLENLQGLTTLKVYQADADRHQEMNRESERFREITMKVLSMQLNSIIVMDVIAYGGAALGICLALLEANTGSLGFSNCLAIILLSAEFFLPMRQLGSFFHVAMNGMTAANNIFQLLDLPVQESKEQVPEGNQILIENLSFGYNENAAILQNVCMTFPAGSFTALVGESGCGKSTIAAILTGKHRNYEGSVCIGGKELTAISESELMRRITLISHNSHIFKGTIRENLLMAKPDAADTELWTALELVKLADFVHSEGGLDMKLTEGGANLSGGQRQRLALSRALVYDSPIIVFDEATSNVDVESENTIMQLVHHLARTKTVILISHRLANSAAADNIYVLERGSAVECGTHQKLLVDSKHYRRLWDSQQALEAIAQGSRQ